MSDLFLQNADEGEEVIEGLGSLFSTGQFHLSKIETFNWGSFDGLFSFDTDKEGIVICGPTGAGKTTIVDAWVSLMIPSGRANFNSAASQDNEKDRSLITYVRGAYGSESNGSKETTRFKRSGATVSAVSCQNSAEDGSCVTQMMLVWTNGSTNTASDFKKQYIVARKQLSIKEVLEKFDNGKNKDFNGWLRDDDDIDAFRSFTEYQECFRNYLYIENPNAPALLTRALGLKRVNDLTQLIRDLVLEPADMQEHARGIVAEFADLQAIHWKLVDEKKYRDMLIDLPGLQEAIEKDKSGLELIQKNSLAAPIYVAMQFAKIWSNYIAKEKENKNALEIESKATTDLITSKQEQSDQLKQKYYEKGGTSIEKLEQSLKEEQSKVQGLSNRASNYQSKCRDLGLDDTLTTEIFNKNLSLSTERLENSSKEGQEIQDEMFRLNHDLETERRELGQLETELEEIKRSPESSIDRFLLGKRAQMCEELGLDKEQVPFVGELIQVGESSKEWTGAIERALGPVKTTLVFPEGAKTKIARWLNENYLGVHFKLTEAFEGGERKAEFFKDGMLRKLEWKVHPYRDWLKRFLVKYDLHCVESAEELNDTVFSITKQGLIKKKKEQLEKNDKYRINDQRQWQLGFSNEHKIEALTEEIASKREIVREIDKNFGEAQKKVAEFGRLEQSLKQIINLSWSEIDVQSVLQSIRTIEKQIVEIREGSEELNSLKEQIDATESEIKELREKDLQINREIGQYESKITSAEEQYEKIYETAEIGLSDEMLDRMQALHGSYAFHQREKYNDILKDINKLYYDRQEKIKDQIKKSESKAVEKMVIFRAHSTGIAEGWTTDMSDIGNYVAHFDYIEREGLPALEEKFKTRLNNNMTQSMASIRNKIDQHKTQIEERIEVLNEVLERNEFRTGTYLRLEIRTEKHDNVDEFNNDLRKILNGLKNPNDEDRYNNIETFVKKLEDASTAPTNASLVSKRLLDPRYRVQFLALEIDKETGATLEAHSNTGGKSGGEKESFAGVIMAASLYYALTPDGSDRPIYATVFLDEAFSNTSDTAARRVMNTFKDLRISVNAITPLKALSVTSEFAKSAIVVERNEKTHSSAFSNMTWVELKKKIKTTKNDRDEQNLSTLEEYDVEIVEEAE